MTCKDFSGMIPAFLNKKLQDRDLSEFLEHYHGCTRCREELEIHYLVDKAFDQIEVGEEVNLSRDLPLFISAQKKSMEARDKMYVVAACMEIIAVCLAIFTAIVYLL